ncbi:MAG TPA: hypothetical protein EYN67_08680 [Flavobacteriales bacterium]|nr:hypothetical protein [Flavobacteriales bacterium]
MTGFRPPGSGLSSTQEDAVDSIVNNPDGNVPKTVGGVFVESSTNENATSKEWVFNKSIEVPQASIKISDPLSISEATLVTITRDLIQSKNIVSVGCAIDDVTGSGKIEVEHVPSFQQVVAQPDFSVTLTSNPLVVPLLATLENQTDRVTVKIASAMTNFRAIIRDNLTGLVIKYIPNKEIVDKGVGGLNLPAGDVIFHFNDDSDDVPLSGLFYLGFTPLRQRAGQAGTLTFFADSVAILGAAFGIPYLENYISFLEETTVPFINDVTNLADPYTRLNNETTSLSGVTGGVVVNYLATSDTDTVNVGQFTAGIAGVSNPTVTTVTGGVFSQGDFVQFNGTVFNDGICEVESHVLNDLTIRGVGTVNVVEGFTASDFITTEDSGTITKVNISVIRSGTSGDWETGKGSVTPLSFSTIGAGIFGTEFEEFSSLPQSSTTSGSFQSKLPVTTATKPAGKYRISFTAQVTNKKKEKGTDLEFKVDGVAQHTHSNGGDYLFHNIKEDNGWVSESITTYTTLGSPATIALDIRYRKDEDEARISDARIDIWRVS